MILQSSPKADKRYMVVINNRTYHFGQKGGSTYIDHKDDAKRDAYIKRHRVNEDWTKVNAGSLSRYILWETTSLKKNISIYKKKFNV
jgi:NDP-sugar pyrophosphorylase family protein